MRYTRSSGEGTVDIKDPLERTQGFARSLGERTGDHLEKEQDIYKITWREKRRYTRSPGEGKRVI